MNFCTSCGARVVSIGRFCTSCGAVLPVSDTGTFTAAPATVHVGQDEPTTAEQVLAFPPRAPLWQTDEDDEPLAPRPSGGRGGLVAFLVSVAIILGVAAVIVVHRTYGGGGDATTATKSKQTAKQSAGASAPSATSTTEATDEASPPAAGEPVVGTAEPGLPSDESDIAADAKVTAPPSARGHVDEHGRPATYPAEAMLDTDPATAWRMSGDGTGRTITLSFGRLVTVTGLALDPGFDKVSANQDRWPQNRRISAATFTMDDGSAFTVGFATDPDLPRSQRLQTFMLPSPVTTNTIKLHIDATEPARRGTFDTTAISRLAVLGS
jgi:hypothetical protein